MLIATTRRLAGATALAALGLSLAACGADSSSGQDDTELSPDQVVLASYEDLRGQSYTMESIITINGVPFVESTSEVNSDGSRTSQDMRLSALLDLVGDEMAQDPALADMMALMFSDVHTESILVDGVLYMQMSGGVYAAIDAQYGPDAWFTIDIAEQADLEEALDKVGGFDLAAQTETLLNSLTDVRETSPGVYTATLRPDTGPMESIMDSMGTVGATAAVESIEMTITLDDSGLLRSMEMNIPELEGATMQIVSTVADIGGQYDVAPPTSTNLHPFESLVGIMG